MKDFKNSPQNTVLKGFFGIMFSLKLLSIMFLLGVQTSQEDSFYRGYSQATKDIRNFVNINTNQQDGTQVYMVEQCAWDTIKYIITPKEGLREDCSENSKK